MSTLIEAQTQTTKPRLEFAVPEPIKTIALLIIPGLVFLYRNNRDDIIKNSIILTVESVRMLLLVFAIYPLHTSPDPVPLEYLAAIDAMHVFCSICMYLFATGESHKQW